MTQRIVTFCMFIFAWVLASQSDAGTSPRYLIKFKKSKGVSISAFQTLQNHHLELKERFPKIDWAVVTPETGQKLTLKQIHALLSSGQIEAVEENQTWHAIEAPYAITPNDPSFSDQMNARRMNLEAAWEVTTGSPQVLVAVSDTGIWRNHEDLASRLWANSREIPGNGKDDDGNGYVDDIWGWNFNAGNSDPTDQHSHGTHVAGIIGAEGNNGVGVAGVNWNVRMMAVQFLDENGSGSTDAGVKTVLYAADNGARAINMSWGGAGYSKALEDALKYASDKGVLLLAASGNDGKDTDANPHYPSTYKVPMLISIASSQGEGSLSSFSNFGARSVDLAAPGSAILSTVLNHGYKKYSGTSMATPMVTGVAALVLSKYPGLAPMTLRNAILNAVDERDEYQGKLTTAGDLNAGKALRQFEDGFQVWPGRVSVEQGDTFTFTAWDPMGKVTWSVEDTDVGSINSSGMFEAKASGQTRVVVRDSQGHEASTVWVKVVAAGEKVPVPGCNKAKTQEKVYLVSSSHARTYESVNAMVSVLLPGLLAFGWVGAGRRKKLNRSGA